MYPSPFLFASLVGRTAAFCSPAFIPNGLSVTARDALPFIVLKEASLRVQSGAMEHSPICLPSSICSIDGGAPSDGAGRLCTGRLSQTCTDWLEFRLPGPPAVMHEDDRITIAPLALRRGQRTCGADWHR